MEHTTLLAGLAGFAVGIVTATMAFIGTMTRDHKCLMKRYDELQEEWKKLGEQSQQLNNNVKIFRETRQQFEAMREAVQENRTVN